MTKLPTSTDRVELLRAMRAVEEARTELRQRCGVLQALIEETHVGLKMEDNHSPTSGRPRRAH